jgi:hypothetical protein
MIREAAQHGLRTDSNGRLIKPENFSELEAEIAAKIRDAVKAR